MNEINIETISMIGQQMEIADSCNLGISRKKAGPFLTLPFPFHNRNFVPWLFLLASEVPDEKP